MWIPGKRLHSILIVASITFIVLSLLPFIRVPIGWIRIWDFPRQQLAFLLGTCLLFWLLIKHWKPAEYLLMIAVTVLMFYHVSKFIPFTPIWQKEISYTSLEQKGHGNQVSILFYNVYIENRKTDKFLELAGKVNADIILLVEPDHFWANQMKPLETDYPHFVSIPKENSYGMILYSKLPLENEEIRYLVEDDVPSIHTHVHLPSGKKFRLYGVHPRPPTPVTDSDKRDAEILILGKMIVERAEACIVSGDLNDVAWSKTTRLFKDISGLKDPRVGRRVMNSFNARIPFVRWPLDHFFLSDHWTLDVLKRLEHIGSDHFPIYLQATFVKPQDMPHYPEDLDEQDKQEAEERIEEGLENE